MAFLTPASNRIQEILNVALPQYSLGPPERKEPGYQMPMLNLCHGLLAHLSRELHRGSVQGLLDLILSHTTPADATLPLAKDPQRRILGAAIRGLWLIELTPCPELPKSETQVSRSASYPLTPTGYPPLLSINIPGHCLMLDSHYPFPGFPPLPVSPSTFSAHSGPSQ